MYSLIKWSVMNESLFCSALTDVQLVPGRIPPEWLISGEPQTRSKLLGKTADRLAYAMLWECGAVSYKWYYSKDEAYIVLSGEGFMTDDKGVEHRYGAGDVAFFPAGTKAVWRHPDHFRKVAVLKDPVSRPLAIFLKLWDRITGRVMPSARSVLTTS
jgi:hypothetical protein